MECVTFDGMIFQKQLMFRKENRQVQPKYHNSVLDNCSGQNKSNTTLKFEISQACLGLFQKGSVYQSY